MGTTTYVELGTRCDDKLRPTSRRCIPSPQASSLVRVQTEIIPAQQSGELRFDGQELWVLATSCVETSDMKLHAGDLITVELPTLAEYQKYTCHSDNPYDDQLSWRRKPEPSKLDAKMQWKKDLMSRTRAIRMRLRM